MVKQHRIEQRIGDQQSHVNRSSTGGQQRRKPKSSSSGPNSFQSCHQQQQQKLEEKIRQLDSGHRSNTAPGKGMFP